MASKAREGCQPVRQTSSLPGPTNRSVGRVSRGAQNAQATSMQSPGTGSGFEAVIEVKDCYDVDSEEGISSRPRRNAAPRPGHFSSLRSVGADGQDRSRSSRSKGHGRQGPRAAPTSCVDVDIWTLSDIDAPVRACTAGRSRDGETERDVDKQARGIAVSSDVPPESTGEGHKSRRAQGFKPRGVKRRPAAEAAKKAKINKSERAGPRKNMDEDSQDEDEEKWPRSLSKLEKFAILESVKNSELSTEVYHMKGTGGVARKNWIANILAPARQDLAENAAYLANPCDVLADKFWKNVQKWVKSQREQLSKWNESHNGTGSAAPDESKLTELHRKRSEAFKSVPAISKAGAVETTPSDSSASGSDTCAEYSKDKSSEGEGDIDSDDDDGGLVSGDGVEGGSVLGDIESFEVCEYDDYDLTQPQLTAPLGAAGSVSRAPGQVQQSMQQRVRSSSKGKGKQPSETQEKTERGNEARDRGRKKLAAFKTTSMKEFLDLSKDDSPSNVFMSRCSGAIEAIASAMASGGGGGPASASASATTPSGSDLPPKKRSLNAAEAQANADLLKIIVSTKDEELLAHCRRSLVKIDEEL